MRRKGHLFLLVMMLGLVFTLSACQRQVSGQIKPAIKPVKITYWHRLTGSWAKAQQKLIKKFNHSQKRYRVVAKSYRRYQKLDQKLKKAAHRGQLPTIAQTPYTNLGDYVDQGLVLPWDSLMYTGKSALSHKELVDINPSFLATGRYQNQQYALPFSLSTRILYYNQKLLNQYHFEVPTTWQQLLQVAQQAKEKHLTPISLDHDFSLELASLAYSANQQLIDDEGQAHWTNPSTQRIIREIATAVQTDLIKVAPQGQYFAQDFKQGQTLFGLGSSATIPELAATDVRWNTALFPEYAGQSTNVLAGNDLILLQGSTAKQQRGAWAFMRFLLKKENVVQWSLATGYAPVTKSAAKSRQYQAALKTQPQLNAMLQSIDTSFSAEKFRGYQHYRQAVLQTLPQLTQTKAPADLLQQLQNEAETQLQGKSS